MTSLEWQGSCDAKAVPAARSRGIPRIIGLPDKVPAGGRSFTCADVWMRNLLPIFIPAMLLGACNSQENARNGSSSATIDTWPSGSTKDDATNRQDARRTYQSTVEGAAPVLGPRTGCRSMCAASRRSAAKSGCHLAVMGKWKRLSPTSVATSSLAESAQRGQFRTISRGSWAAASSEVMAPRQAAPILPSHETLRGRSSLPVVRLHQSGCHRRDRRTILSVPASCRTASSFRSSLCAQLGRSRSGARGSKGAALPIRTRKTSKELAFGRDLWRRRKATCGAARLAGANSNCGPMPHRAVPTVCRKRTIPWRWSFWSTASAERVVPNQCEAGNCSQPG